MYNLIFTDGYAIHTELFRTKEAATLAMRTQYLDMKPEKMDEEWEELSDLNENSAILYLNGEDVYVWKIQDLDGPVLIHSA